MFVNVWNKKHPDYQWDDDAMVEDPEDSTKQVRKFGLLIKNGSGFDNMVNTQKTVEWIGKKFTMKDGSDPYAIVQKGDMIRLVNKDPHSSPKELNLKVNDKARSMDDNVININNPPPNPTTKTIEFELLVNQVGKSSKVKTKILFLTTSLFQHK